MTTETKKDFGEKGQAMIAEWQACKANINELLNEIKKADKANPLDVLEKNNDMEAALDDIYNKALLLKSVTPDKALADACELCEQQIDELNTELSLDRELFEAFAALDKTHASLDALAKRVLEKILRDFKRSGVDRDEATREKVRALRKRMTKVSQKFERNIREDVRSVDVTDAGRLAGLPQDWINARQPDDKGVIKVTTDMPDYLPVMIYADDESLREELFMQKTNLGYPDNESALKELLEVRHELATTLGYDCWADYATEELMIKSGKNIDEFVNRVADLGRPKSDDDLKVLLEKKRTIEENAGTVNTWESFYLTRLVKEERYQVDPKEVRKYFNVENVVAGLLRLSEQLFDIRFDEKKEADIWHESVKIFDVVDEKGVIGTIYLDLHPRENKYKHAAMFPLVNGGNSDQRKAKGAIVTNFPDPAKSQGRALMEHSEVVTFFHEFGHLLHQILAGRQHWVRFSGVATEWDFVEVPSQLFEEWAWDWEILKEFATDEAGEPIPQALVERMRAGKEFARGLQVLQQMFYASISLNLYNKSPEGVQFDEFIRTLQEKYSPYPFTPGTHFYTGFGHLVEYSSNYYTYMWSLVIVKDIYEQFKKHGLGDTALSKKYKDAILAAGGSNDAGLLVKDFLGREFSFDAFRNWLS